MIDLHCHILPAIDDGAADLADSVGMARQGVADGVEAICATPHIRHDHDVRIAELEGRVEAVNRRLVEENVPIVVLQGGEVAETAVEGLDEEDLARVTLGAGRWVLLEPAPGPLGDSLERRVEELSARGRRALIAHPERHVAADMFERLARLVDRGALIQMTADYLLREQMADGMLAMAAAGAGPRSLQRLPFLGPRQAGGAEPRPRAALGRRAPGPSYRVDRGDGPARDRRGSRARGSLPGHALVQRAQLDPPRQVGDNGSVGAAEAVAEEVRGAGRCAGP